MRYRCRTGLAWPKGLYAVKGSNGFGMAQGPVCGKGVERVWHGLKGLYAVKVSNGFGMA